MPAYAPSPVAARHRPSGAVPTTGTPPVTSPAGVYDFATPVYVVGATPVVDRAAFPARLAQTIAELVPGGALDPAGVSISIGDPAPVALPVTVRDRLAAGARLAAAALFAPLLGAATVYNAASRIEVPARWVTIRGTINAMSEWTTADVNRAIARAFANTVTWTDVSPAYRAALPPAGDGSSLLAAMTACANDPDLAAVYARACTRFGASDVRPAVTPPAPAPPPEPTVNFPPRTPVDTGFPWGKVLFATVLVAGVAVVAKRDEIAKAIR